MRNLPAFSVLLSAMLAFTLSACQTSGGTQRPPGSSSPSAAAVPAEAAAPASQLAAASSIATPIHLHSITSTVGKGRSIDKPKVDLLSCARPITEMRWGLSSDDDVSDGHRQEFIEAFSSAGLNMIEAQASAFVASDALERADLLLGGVITDFSMRSCRWGWDNSYAGDAVITLRWEVYSQLEDSVIFQKTMTSNFSDSEHQHEIEDFVGLALEQAAKDLARDPQLRELLAGHTQALSKQAALEEPDWEPRDISGAPIRSIAFTTDPDPVLDATVVLAAGGSHGSGFVVSQDGYILTNAHVVGRRQYMTVRFRNGREFEGRVLRRHVERDVALVKIEADSLPVLALRMQGAKIGETVYSIGAPRLQALESTVSRGIISAFRPGAKNGYDLIQADALIHGGNSGGPLVDANGNVIAIAVSGITDSAQKLGSGIGFFIPIASGLETLKLTVR